MKLFRELRLVPVVLFATVCLLALKLLGLVMDDQPPLAEINFGPALHEKASLPALAPPAAASSKTSWAGEMFNFPEVTGSVAAKKPDKEKEEKKDAKAPEPPPPDGKLVPLGPGSAIPPGERALLERLQERREVLDARARELDMRENLLKAAEHQLEIRMGELKELETRLQAAAERKEEGETIKLKSLVTMYENMKAKDAARIFDRLDLAVLLDVASQMKPRTMSDIMAQMQPASAERLTVELANRANAGTRALAPKELPKIEGKPAGR